MGLRRTRYLSRSHALFLQGQSIFLVLWTPALESGSASQGGLSFRRRPLAYWLDYLRNFSTNSSELIVQSQSKPAADPWQDLPRLADLFDSQTPQPFFKGSKVPELEELALPETQLLEQTAALLGVSLAQLVKSGAIVYAKREYLNHKKYSAAAEGGSESALLRSGSGVADARILAAYQVMADAKVPITPAKLASRAVTGYPTALRWLKIHPRIIGVQARRGLRCSGCRHSRPSCRPRP
jgi:hypothetical protein